MLLISKKNLKISYLSPKKGDVPHSQGDIKLAQKELGFIPTKSLTEGLKDLIQSNSF